MWDPAFLLDVFFSNGLVSGTEVTHPQEDLPDAALSTPAQECLLLPGGTKQRVETVAIHHYRPTVWYIINIWT